MGPAAGRLETLVDPIGDTLPSWPFIFVPIRRLPAATRTRLGSRLPRCAALIWYGVNSPECRNRWVPYLVDPSRARIPRERCDLRDVHSRILRRGKRRVRSLSLRRPHGIRRHSGIASRQEHPHLLGGCDRNICRDGWCRPRGGSRQSQSFFCSGR